MFNPDVNRPLWYGNIKKYYLGTLDDGSVGVVDANGYPVLNTSTQPATFYSSSVSGWSTVVDGANVLSGGAAELIPDTRRLITAPYSADSLPSGATTLTPFNVDEALLTASLMGVETGDRDAVINWASGQDVKDEDGDGNTSENRQRMGAAIHTTPVVLTYNDDDNNKSSVLFAGTQEGYLHAIDTQTGEELWAYVPYEMYGNIGVNYEDNDNGSVTYGLDRNITISFDDNNANGAVDADDSAYITIGMRRGSYHYSTPGEIRI